MRVAVIGAGIAGAACARALADAGHAVHVFDKSRGAGGRLSSRRAALDDGAALRFDHGAPGFAASDPAFCAFAEQAQRDGLLARWTPRLAPDGRTPDDGALWVPTPDMPALCRALLSGLPLHTLCAVDALRRPGAKWRLDSVGATLADGFDAVAVAIPPEQAAPLLDPHRADWAARIRALPMLPAWVLMGVTDAPANGVDWDAALPPAGPAALVLRSESRPARAGLPGLAQWVVHATPDWSRAWLEAPPDAVQAALQEALAECVGSALAWRHAAVHRWRYATLAPAQSDRSADADLAPGTADPLAGAAQGCAMAPSAPAAWLDAGAGLGVCGDALGGGGVEGAWRSGRALAARLALCAAGNPA